MLLLLLSEYFWQNSIALLVFYTEFIYTSRSQGLVSPCSQSRGGSIFLICINCSWKMLPLKKTILKLSAYFASGYVYKYVHDILLSLQAIHLLILLCWKFLCISQGATGEQQTRWAIFLSNIKFNSFSDRIWFLSCTVHCQCILHETDHF